MIGQRDLAQRLARRNLAGWSVTERLQDVAIADELRSVQRRDHRTRLTAVAHVDVPRGRGTARLDIDPLEASADDIAEQLVSLAHASVGPAWSSTPPAAPAKVNLLDDSLVARGIDAVAASLLAGARRPSGVTVLATAEVLREKVTVLASSGFRTTWLASALRFGALLSASSASAAAAASPPASASAPSSAGAAPADASPVPRPAPAPVLALSRHARRIADLDLDTALTDAAADLQQIIAAGAPQPGPCAIWLGPEAIVPGGDPGSDQGLFAVFAHQADSAVERRGLTRYRWRAEIAPGATQHPEPLSILSNGALDFATLSSPVSDDAIAVRRFPLIERGMAVGLGISPREAAFRRTDPNGGVRNLVVVPGTWSPAPSPSVRTIEVRRLHALSIDLSTGDATLDIALALDHHPGRATPTPFTGGTLHLDLISALARARRSPDLLRRGAYHGPANLLLDSAELLA